MTTSASPATPEPDAKDWTWAIHEPCPECGFDPRAVEHDDIAAATRRYAGALGAALDRADASTRPAPAVWAPVEYACHVRDVCTIFAGRLRLMLIEDDPMFANWDQDDAALTGRYWEQRPAEVRAQLATAAAAIADDFAAVDGAAWQRPGRRSNGSVFTVDTFARYFLHDLAHHAWDVDRSRSSRDGRQDS
jgi:hypothetical protein